MLRATGVYRVLTVLACAGCLVGVAPSGLAQLTTTATITGTVRDTTGAVIPQATITILNEQTGIQTTTESNAEGSFAVPALQVGRYTLKVAKQGFQTYTETGIDLHPSTVATVNPVMKLGSLSTEVTVTATATQIQSSTPEVASSVGEQQVATLPLNGRNYQSLSALMPGVTNLAPGVAAGPGGFLTSNTMSINGMGTAGTLYTLDGIWNMNTGNMTQTTITPNPDTVQEVRVLQNNYSVQYNLLGTSVVLLQTKSGTTAFRGTAYEYLRNTSLNARDFFSPTRPPLHQNIFGYTLGGPFVIPHHYNTNKRKTFFFWSQQWTRQNIGRVVRGADPTAAMRGGDFSGLCTFGFDATGLCKDASQQLKNPATGQPFLNNAIPPGKLSQDSLALLNALAPLPNNPAGGFLNYLNVNPTVNNTRDDEIRVDHNFGEKVRLMAEYLDDRQVNGNATNTFLGSPYSTNHNPVTTNNQLAQIQLTQTLSPSMVNTTSIAMNNYVVSLAQIGITQQSQVPGFHEVLPFHGFLSDRLPQIGFAKGWAPLGVALQLPLNHASDLEDTFSDDWSWLRGNHYIQAGLHVVLGTKRQANFNASNGQWFFNGQFSGNPIADYLLGYASTFFQTSTVPRPYMHYTIVSPYVQDRWKVSRRLTVTAGLRLEYLPIPHAQQGYDTVFDPRKYNPANAPIVNPNGTITPTPTYDPLNGLIFNGLNGVPLNFTNAHNYFAAPSVGFAWDVFGDGRTSVRGGYGISYFRTFTSGDCSYNCSSNPPRVVSISLLNPSFPNPIGAQQAAPTIQALNGTVDFNFQPLQEHTYSLSIEHEFAGNWLASIAGAGVIERHWRAGGNFNQPLPNPPFDFNPVINAGKVTPYLFAPYPGYAAMPVTMSSAHGYWNALELSLRHPVGHNLFLTVAYTWQHGLDSGSVQNTYQPGAYYGNTSTYVPQVLSLSYIWTIPWYQNARGVEGAVLKGWKYSGITTIQSGFALTPGMSLPFNGLASRPNRQAGTAVTGPKTVAQWFNTAAFVQPPPGYFGNAATGSIRGPGTVDFDMAFYKDFRIQEHHKFEFRGEFFNVFNHTNFAGVSTALGAGNFGRLTSARDPRIAELALRYEF